MESNEENLIPPAGVDSASLLEKKAISRFNAFLESAPDAIVVVDDHGRIAMINHLTEEMFGYTREELVGNTVELLVPERYRHVHIAHRRAYSAHPKTRPMGMGRALTGRKKDGSEFPIEISLSPFQDENATLVISIIRDTTIRQKAEAKFQGLLESAPDGIVVVDTKGRIVVVNTQTERMFGYSREELLDKPIEILVPNRFKESHERDRIGYVESPRTRPMGAGRALTGRKKDGTEFPVEISLSPLETEQGMLITSIVRDITDRREAEEQIKVSLREKEVLLREIHHRVKNNLQVISSLLKLQSVYIQDKHSLEMFSESQNRIRSMALVHEKLYQSSDLSGIDFPEYIQSLASLLFRSYGVDSDLIKLKIIGEQLLLTVETAVPSGLIINELLSNSLKHAFPGGRSGEIRIQVGYHHDGQTLILAVADNGIGLPKGLDTEKTETLGLRLVRTLARQLNGELEVNKDDWTEFKVCCLLGGSP